jgi:hypothetical protein
MRLFARVKGVAVLRYTNLRSEQESEPTTIYHELVALRGAHRLSLDNDTIIAMPRVRLLPEKHVLGLTRSPPRPAPALAGGASTTGGPEARRGS